MTRGWPLGIVVDREVSLVFHCYNASCVVCRVSDARTSGRSWREEREWRGRLRDWRKEWHEAYPLREVGGKKERRKSFSYQRNNYSSTRSTSVICPLYIVVLFDDRSLYVDRYIPYVYYVTLATVPICRLSSFFPYLTTVIFLSTDIFLLTWRLVLVHRPSK